MSRLISHENACALTDAPRSRDDLTSRDRQPDGRAPCVLGWLLESTLLTVSNHPAAQHPTNASVHAAGRHRSAPVVVVVVADGDVRSVATSLQDVGQGGEVVSRLYWREKA